MEQLSKIGIGNIFLVLALVLLLTIPFIINEQSEFMGTDSQAEDLIMTSNPQYEPWVAPFWEPPGGEVETLLFTLQAILGSSFIAYYVGYRRGQKGANKSNESYN